MNTSALIPIKVKKGMKIYFQGENKPYTVRCFSERFVICTKPFNLKRTVIYTIIDWIREIRGTENTVFCMGFETDQDCNEALERLVSGESEVSYRNYVDLTIYKWTYDPQGTR